MRRYIADPHTGDGRIVTLAASVSSAQDARNAAVKREREWIDLQRERELQDVARVMHQRTGVCG